MTDYSVINNVSTCSFGFIHSTSRHVLLESSTRTTFLRSFLSLLGKMTPTTLGSRHRSRLWSHMPHSFETSGRNRRFWKLLLGCARRYIVCPLSGRQGGSTCHIVWRRAMARNATYTKTSQRNRTYTSLFSILHIYNYIVYIIKYKLTG